MIEYKNMNYFPFHVIYKYMQYIYNISSSGFNYDLSETCCLTFPYGGYHSIYESPKFVNISTKINFFMGEKDENDDVRI